MVSHLLNIVRYEIIIIIRIVFKNGLTFIEHYKTIIIIIKIVFKNGLTFIEHYKTCIIIILKQYFKIVSHLLNIIKYTITIIIRIEF